MAKVGRPKSDNPKADKFSFRLNADTVKALDDYCEKYSVSRSEAIRLGIEALTSGKAPAIQEEKREKRDMPSFLL